ncbi:MAG TPA: amidase [Candidatus Dormibacteraeota bacterium]|nr:amidase [Candidatus Dormibacteraeota bacterium]
MADSHQLDPWLSLTDLSRDIHSGEVSPVEVVTDVLRRIAALNPVLNCYITVLEEAALQQAAALEKLLLSGIDLGPLHGVPIAVKDNIDTVGVRTTVGSRVFADRVPDADATVIERLKAAGAVIVGKANMYEFANGSWHPDYGETRNPWDTSRSCYGSSSGSASAVAAGLAHGSVGTDTGGSIRYPAALCGVVGFKPSYGVVSRAGVYPLSPDLDHVGPLGRTVADVALQFAAMHGHEPGAGLSSQTSRLRVEGIERGIRGLRIGTPRLQPGEMVAAEVQAAIAAALGVLESQGARVVEVDVPDHLVSCAAVWTIFSAEFAEHERALMQERPNDYSKVVRAAILDGEFIPATDYVRAQRVRQAIRAAYRDVMEDVDVLALPVTPVPALKVGAETIDIDGHVQSIWPAFERYCPTFNATGLPALSVPCGFNQQSLPLALQLVGRHLGDWTVLRVGNAYQQATTWHESHPGGLGS